MADLLAPSTKNTNIFSGINSVIGLAQYRYLFYSMQPILLYSCFFLFAAGSSASFGSWTSVGSECVTETHVYKCSSRTQNSKLWQENIYNYKYTITYNWCNAERNKIYVGNLKIITEPRYIYFFCKFQNQENVTYTFLFCTMNIYENSINCLQYTHARYINGIILFFTFWM